MMCCVTISTLIAGGGHPELAAELHGRGLVELLPRALSSALGGTSTGSGSRDSHLLRQHGVPVGRPSLCLSQAVSLRHSVLQAVGELCRPEYVGISTDRLAQRLRELHDSTTKALGHARSSARHRGNMARTSSQVPVPARIRQPSSPGSMFGRARSASMELAMKGTMTPRRFGASSQSRSSTHAVESVSLAHLQGTRTAVTTQEELEPAAQSSSVSAQEPAPSADSGRAAATGSPTANAPA